MEGRLPYFGKPGALSTRTGVPPGMKKQLLKMRAGKIKKLLTSGGLVNHNEIGISLGCWDLLVQKTSHSKF